MIFFSALVLLAGCSGVPPHRLPNQPPPPNWDVSQDEAAHSNAVSHPLLPLVPLPTSPVLQTNPPAHPTPDFSEETWIGLDHWAKACGFEPADRLSLDPLEMTITNGYEWHNFKLKAWVSLIPLPTFVLHTTNGVLMIQAETQEAHWDGVEIHLGFDPELVQGEPLIHRLDLTKTIEPLLRGLPPIPDTNRTIVIDPDASPADRSLPENLRGKDFALDWAQRLASLLATNGWSVRLTRTNDSKGSLAGRAAFADTHPADLFLNLCFRMDATDKNQGGLGTYCLTPTRMSSTLPPDLFEETWQTFPNNAFDVENWQFAFRIERALTGVPDMMDLGLCRSRSIRMLHARTCPAVSVCGGYLSNPHDSRLIASPSYRQELAEAVASALR